MFGFIYSVFASVAAFIGYAKDCQENNENKVKFRSQDGLTYIDTRGNDRLISTNEMVFYTMRNGDYVLIDAHSRVIKNYTEEKRQKALSERIAIASKNGSTVYAISEDRHERDWYCKGTRYKDFKTGEIYVVRQINGRYYYLNLSNGMIVRRTDWQRQEDEKNKDNEIYQMYERDVYYLDIDQFNEKQKTVTDKYSLYRNWEYSLLCDIFQIK